MFNGRIKLNVGSKSKSNSTVRYTGRDEEIRDKYLSKVTGRKSSKKAQMVG